VVAGIDSNQARRRLEESGDGCIYTAGDLEQLAHVLESRYRFAQYVNPVLVGYGSGAMLAYGSLVQSPAGTFRGAVSVGFCPELSWSKPLCPGDKPGLVAAPAGPAGFTYQPVTQLRDPWLVIPGPNHAACDVNGAPRFTAQVAGARFVEAGGLTAAYDALADSKPAQASALPGRIADLPLVNVPARGPATELLAIILTGDGGWAGLDREVASALAAKGVAAVGWDSLRYFWRARTPEGAAADLDRVIRHYTAGRPELRVVAIGYSMGADNLPFMLNRLPAETRTRVAAVALLTPGPEAFFEFHMASWIGAGTGGLPVEPEIRRLAPMVGLCLYGREETDSVCTGLRGSSLRVQGLPGGHHFDGDFAGLARLIVAAVPAGN
jgi:type IV secretory pathway VirJ component